MVMLLKILSELKNESINLKSLKMPKIFFLIGFVIYFLILTLGIHKLSVSQINANNKILQQVPGGDKGIGPFQNVPLGAIDNARVKKGLTIFISKCMVCHELDKVKIGPPLREITKQRTPEFILNMIVNPVEMQKSNPEIKKQFIKYHNIPMTDLQISKEDAKNILDYLRSIAK